MHLRHYILNKHLFSVGANMLLVHTCVRTPKTHTTRDKHIVLDTLEFTICAVAS